MLKKGVAAGGPALHVRPTPGKTITATLTGVPWVPGALALSVSATQNGRFEATGWQVGPSLFEVRGLPDGEYAVTASLSRGDHAPSWIAEGSASAGGAVRLALRKDVNR